VKKYLIYRNERRLRKEKAWKNNLKNFLIILDLGHRWESLLCQKSIEQHQLWGKENWKESHFAVHGRSCLKEGGEKFCRSVGFSVHHEAR
jgi:hypothetical protein